MAEQEDATLGWADPRDLVPFEGNARKHSPDQIEAIKSIMRRFGFTAPVVVWAERGIIAAGHGRCLAAAELIEEGERAFERIPIRRVSFESEDEFRAYVLADNRLGELSEWDNEILRIELGDLQTSGFDLDLTGFDAGALTIVFAEGDDPNDPAGHWGGMPEFEQQDQTAFKSITVNFADLAGVEAFSKLVGQKIGPKTRSIWHPEATIRRYADKQYAPE